MKQNKAKQYRRFWFRCVTKFMRIFFRRRHYLFLGDVPQDKSIIFSNHVGASAPIFHELYAPFKLRFWGTHEMTEPLRENFKYLSNIYLPEKKGHSKFGSKILATIICPFTKIFYAGLKLIPTYKDAQFIHTIKLTEKSLNNGENIIIFPEDSHDGYHKHLTGYYGGGFFAADKYCKKFNCDISIYNCYYIQETRTFVVDKAIPFSELKKEFGSDYVSMAKKFCDRANEIGETYNQKRRSK